VLASAQAAQAAPCLWRLDEQVRSPRAGQDLARTARLVTGRGAGGAPPPSSCYQEGIRLASSPTATERVVRSPPCAVRMCVSIPRYRSALAALRSTHASIAAPLPVELDDDSSTAAVRARVVLSQAAVEREVDAGRPADGVVASTDDLDEVECENRASSAAARDARALGARPSANSASADAIHRRHGRSAVPAAPPPAWPHRGCSPRPPRRCRAEGVGCGLARPPLELEACVPAAAS